MSLKHAILGFLSYQTFSGYDLKKAFDRSVQHFWPANQSQIYRTLASMKEEGLVEQEVIEREERLDMKLYHITAAGREELHRWLSTPFQSSDAREPFLIQIYFGGIISDDELLNVLQHMSRDIEGRLALFRSMVQAYQERLKTNEDQRDFFLNLVTLEYGILNGVSTLEWIKSVIQRVESGDYTLKDIKPV
jgi:PadR family transcriptional regulator AphA